MEIGEIFFVSNERWSHKIGDVFPVRQHNTSIIIMEAVDKDKSEYFIKYWKLKVYKVRSAIYDLITIKNLYNFYREGYLYGMGYRC